MISWIVASHDPAVLEANLVATLTLEAGDELIVIDAPSIAAAYNQGQERAIRPIRCYVHHDVQILDNAALRAQLIDWCRPPIGIVGIVGSRARAVPWWEGFAAGSVDDTRTGPQLFGKGGDVAYLDGLLLASSYQLDWDETIPGWHLYDHDVCEQSLRAGRINWCLDNGHQLVRHNTTSGFDTTQLPGWTEALAAFNTKWGRA